MIIKAFNRWETEDIKVEDPGLQKYISLEPKIMPKTGARYASKRFHKSKIFIVERLINKLMVSGHKGKKHYICSNCLESYLTLTNSLICPFCKVDHTKIDLDYIIVIDYDDEIYDKDKWHNWWLNYDGLR